MHHSEPSSITWRIVPRPVSFASSSFIFRSIQQLWNSLSSKCLHNRRTWNQNWPIIRFLCSCFFLFFSKSNNTENIGIGRELGRKTWQTVGNLMKRAANKRGRCRRGHTRATERQASFPERKIKIVIHSVSTNFSSDLIRHCLRETWIVVFSKRFFYDKMEMIRLWVQAKRRDRGITTSGVGTFAGQAEVEWNGDVVQAGRESG